MEKVKCPASCGLVGLCLMACPYNSRLDQVIVPVCEPLRVAKLPEEEAFEIVVEDNPQ